MSKYGPRTFQDDEVRPYSPHCRRDRHLTQNLLYDGVRGDPASRNDFTRTGFRIKHSFSRIRATLVLVHRLTAPGTRKLESGSDALVSASAYSLSAPTPLDELPRKHLRHPWSRSAERSRWIGRPFSHEAVGWGPLMDVKNPEFYCVWHVHATVHQYRQSLGPGSMSQTLGFVQRRPHRMVQHAAFRDDVALM